MVIAKPNHLQTLIQIHSCILSNCNCFLWKFIEITSKSKQSPVKTISHSFLLTPVALGTFSSQLDSPWLGTLDGIFLWVSFGEICTNLVHFIKKFDELVPLPLKVIFLIVTPPPPPNFHSIIIHRTSFVERSFQCSWYRTFWSRCLCRMCSFV